MDLEAIAPLLRPEGWALLETLDPYDSDEAMAVSGRLRAAGHDPALVAAALTQARLRAAAAPKLGSFAASMLFTPDGLEQATRLPVAARHAGRLRGAGAARVADLGCGIGVDSMAMAGMGVRVDAVERDEVTAAVATINLRHFEQARVVVGDATDYPACLGTGGRGAHARGPQLPDAVWCDPARRAAGHRVAEPERWSPPLSWVLALPSSEAGSGLRAVGAKVAPGIDRGLLDGPAAGWTAEWTSVDGDVVEAVLWWGAAATTGVRRQATVLRSEPGPEPAVSDAAGVDDAEQVAEPAVGPVGGVLYEPDGAVIRAGLVGTVAAHVGGRLLDSTIAYVTADSPIDTPLARAYEVEAVLPWGLKRLRAYLRSRGVGRVTVKRRGSPIEPDELRQALRLDGDGEATVVLTRSRGERVVIVARPVSTAPARAT